MFPPGPGAAQAPYVPTHPPQQPPRPAMGYHHPAQGNNPPAMAPRWPGPHPPVMVRPPGGPAPAGQSAEADAWPQTATPRPHHPRPGQIDPARDYSVFVGDLDYNVDDRQLHEAFVARKVQVVQAKVVVDLVSGTSKGFAFVKLASQQDRDRAIAELHGSFIGSRPVRVTEQTTREQRGEMGPLRSHGGPRGLYEFARQADEGENTCVFVGGLDESVTPDMLRHHFGLLGDIAYIRIPPGRGCGFVGFVHRKNAESAISTLQGLRINGYKVRLAWGSMRQPPKAARAVQSIAQNKVLATAAVRGGGPTPILGGQIPNLVTGFKKEHKTPLGTLTHEYLDVLPDPAPPWSRPPFREDNPPGHAPLADVLPPGLEHQPLPPGPDRVENLPPRLAHVLPPPASPYVAQLRARYRAYNLAVDAALGPNSPSRHHKPARKILGSGRRRREEDNDELDPYLPHTRRSAQPGRVTPDELYIDQARFALWMDRNVLGVVGGPGVLQLPVPEPPAVIDPSDAISRTPMASFLSSEQQHHHHQVPTPRA